ncbi:MAG: diaminopimelate epimerase [Bryobacterales bacterium]|nr:diaminopimelate epimerase [Bryobacterales bacterium]
MRIPFAKAHGARNDFLLTWAHSVPEVDHRALARAICDRHAGVGADGWMIVTPAASGDAYHGAIQLYNSDGSDSEISGNGTRCAAAFLIDAGHAEDEIRIATGAGLKHIRVLGRNGLAFDFEMNMGQPRLAAGDLFTNLDVHGRPYEAILLDVGNPQCALLVDNFDFDWRRLGKALEHHPHFPNRTNVSFVQVLDQHTIDVRFWERGAGETESSGTGSTGAAVAAVLAGRVEAPITVETPAGALRIRIDKNDYYLQGPAEIIAGGEFYFAG